MKTTMMLHLLDTNVATMMCLPQKKDILWSKRKRKKNKITETLKKVSFAFLNS